MQKQTTYKTEECQINNRSVKLNNVLFENWHAHYLDM